MMAEDEKLIENSISRFGLRTLDIIRFGQPVDVERWLKLVPGEAWDLVMVARRVEPELQIHHAVITWNAREMVGFKDAPIKYGALWWINKHEHMSDAIDLASSLFKLRTGEYPTRCWVNELPKEAPDAYEIEGFTNDPPKKPITLRMAGWVPERFVCVGIELSEAEVVLDLNGKFEVEYRVKESAHE